MLMPQKRALPGLSMMSLALPAGQVTGAEEGSDNATELIFTLRKYGSGWGEELLPRLVVEQRPLRKRERVRNRSSFPDAWEVSDAAPANPADGSLSAKSMHSW